MVTNFEQLAIYGTHFEVGKSIGSHFAAQIHEAFNNYSFFHNQILPYHHTHAGATCYIKLLELHRARFPAYIQELEGVAEGANRPFRDIFLINLRVEYLGFINEVEGRGCSDCSLLTNDVALIGHNEDGSPTFGPHMYFLSVHVDGSASFMACSYPGFLCGNAFGFNTHGICASIDDIRPSNVRLGLGRHFLARSLLDAKSIADAITRITLDNRASGFSYTIGSVDERRIVEVEVTPESYHVHEIRGASFHANHILNMENATQLIEPSSAARVRRANELMKQNKLANAVDILNILGDRSDQDYPVYRTASVPDNLETFCTALFDLDARELRVYLNNPAEDQDDFITFHMDTSDIK